MSDQQPSEMSVNEQQQQQMGREGGKMEKDVDEEKLRDESPQAAESGGGPVSPAASARAAEAVAAPMSNEYRTADTFFTALCRAKADGFALSPDKPPGEQPIWICNREDKVIDVFNGLIKRNISSVPVLLKSAKYFGFLDIMVRTGGARLTELLGSRDIVRYVVANFGAAELSHKKWEERSFFELLNEEKEFAKKTVDDLMQYPYAPKRNPFHPIQQGYSAFAVVEALARQRGLHRVPVIDSSRRIVNLVTNSQVLKFLNDNIDMIGPILIKPLDVCGKRFIKPVLTVDEETAAIDAFQLMVTKDVDGLAICNKEGRLRGNISLRDLKIVGADLALFWRLHQTIKNFVLKLRHEYALRHKRPRTVVYVLGGATVGEVIRTMAKQNIHRVYICNSHQQKEPVGIVTITDLLMEIISS